MVNAFLLGLEGGECNLCRWQCEEVGLVEQ